MKLLSRIMLILLLAAAFVIIEVALILNLLALARHDAAAKLADDRLWIKAEELFNEAIKLNPISAEYRAGFGDFMLNEAVARGMDVSFFYKAKALFSEAVSLNPRNAEYYLKAAQVDMAIFLEGGRQGPIKDIVDSFKKAYLNDPNNFNISYGIGYSMIAMWDLLDADAKEFTIARLKYAIKTYRPHAGIIYKRLWQKTADFTILKKATPENLAANIELFNYVFANNMTRHFKDQRREVEYYRKLYDKEALKEEIDKKKARLARIKNLSSRLSQEGPAQISKNDWRGTDSTGKYISRDGMLPWNGTIDAAIRIPKGSALIHMKAKGEAANNVYPYMIIELDGEVIDELFVDSPEWKEYTFKVNTDAGLKVVSVTFINDGFDPVKGEDRNLYIGEAKVEAL